MLRSLFLLLAVCSSILIGGCGRSRVVTIVTDPPDAIIRVDSKDRGRGPITETFTFGGDSVAHAVSVRRAGYDEQSVTVTQESPETLRIRLKPASRRITVRVKPADAVVKLDGKVLSPDPAGEITQDVEFPLDASGAWTTRQLTAEHPKFQPSSETLTYNDRKAEFVLDLAAMRKDLSITTVPADAEVFFNDDYFGPSPVTRAGVPFPVDEASGEYVPQKVRVEKPGFATLNETIDWDEGRQNYEWTLSPQSKLVRIITDPADATVVLGNVEVPLDATGGGHSRRGVQFPLNAKGQAAAYEVIVSKRTGDREWEDARRLVSWDEGRTDYTIQLKEILTRPVPMLRVRTARSDAGWTISGERSTTRAMRDTGEGPDAPAPVQITRLPKGTMIDTVVVAPDGSQVLFTTLTMSDATGELRSQILAQRTDGPADTIALSDGQSLEITPAFTPDGSLVVFASNRAGRKLSIWSTPATGAGGVSEQLTAGPDSNDLWPSVDSSPTPRLFYQSLVDTRSDARLFSTQIGAVGRRDLATAGGTQPRVGPKADAIVFAAAAADMPGGKRDIFRMSDQGGAPVNLTNTPDADEFDPAWSNDGRRVAYVSDAGRSTGQPDNYDIYVLDTTREGADPMRVTVNGSWDDSPAWDVGGRAIYFRSNRGGEWNVWRVGLR